MSSYKPILNNTVKKTVSKQGRIATKSQDNSPASPVRTKTILKSDVPVNKPPKRSNVPTPFVSPISKPRTLLTFPDTIHKDTQQRDTAPNDATPNNASTDDTPRNDAPRNDATYGSWGDEQYSSGFSQSSDMGEEVTLQMILDELLWFAKEHPTESPIGILSNKIGNNIKIRKSYEETDPLPTQTAHNQTTDEQPLQCRLHLSTAKSRSDFSQAIHRICNGVIIDYPSCEVIALPPPMPNPKYRVADVISYMSRYAIYEIYDGTVITLYYYKNKWRFSTTNGFEVNDYKWIGPPTYEDEFLRICKKYPSFSLDELDTDLSYSFGMRSHHFHPLKEDPEKIWLICSYNRVTCKYEHIDTLCGIACQKPIVDSYTSNKQRFGQLEKMMKSAYDNFKQNRTNPHYGYILRAIDDDVPSKVNNVILKSTLLTLLRTTVYNLPKRSTHVVYLDNDARPRYVMFRAYLNPARKDVIAGLFPWYVTLYKVWDRFFDSLAEFILNNLNQPSNAGSTKLAYRLSQKFPTVKETELEFMENAVTTMINYINSIGGVSPIDKDSKSIIRDFLLNKDLINAHFRYIPTQ